MTAPLQATHDSWTLKGRALFSPNGSAIETRETGNARHFLAIVSEDRPAVGYLLNEQIGEMQTQWPDNSHVRIWEKPGIGDSGAARWERTFDIIADPPTIIP